MDINLFNTGIDITYKQKLQIRNKDGIFRKSQSIGKAVDQLKLAACMGMSLGTPWMGVGNV